MFTSPANALQVPSAVAEAWLRLARIVLRPGDDLSLLITESESNFHMEW